MERLPPLPSGTVVVCYRCYPNGWSFYSKQLVTVVTANDGYELQSNYIRFALQGTEVWPERMIRGKDFPRWLATLRVPAMILAKRDDAPEVGSLLAERGAAMGALTDEFVGALLLPKEM
jgi:hypothetical protein